jgi:hypothetical protein
MRPFRVTVPVMAFFVIVEGALIYLHYGASAPLQKTIEFAAAITGAGTAIYGVMLGVHADRVKAAGRFIERWTDPAFAASRNELGRVLERLKDTPDSPLSPDDSSVIATGLNYFEDLSLAVLTGRADEATLFGFFYTPLREIYGPLKPRIEHTRTKRNQPTLFENCETLYQRWHPSRPRIGFF